MSAFTDLVRTKGVLRLQGVDIDTVKQVGRVYLINVFSPSVELRQRAIEVIEAFGGIRRRAYIVKFQQCWVIWR